MTEPYISSKFDLEDIRRIREQNSEHHRFASTPDLQTELSAATQQFLIRLEKLGSKPSA